MFCALNGATRIPLFFRYLQIAVAIQLLPACDVVPPTKAERFEISCLPFEEGDFREVTGVPELVPGEAQGAPGQASEATLGPFELQNFFLYYTSRFGFAPSRVAYLAEHAWSDRRAGTWPEGIAEADRREYDLAAIKRWLAVFLRRFFETSQFKRSAMPNAPKVGSGGSLSPRGDWRAPSDAHADAWLQELDREVP